MTCIKFIELSNRIQCGKKYITYDVFVKETRYDLREALIPYILEKAIEYVVALLKKHDIALRIETPRKESLGYCKSNQNIIGINNDLEKDRFLSVFIHEYAHQLTFSTFLIVPVHGAEFYYCFQELVLKFISIKIIPKEMFLPIVNRSGDYEYYKKYDSFKFRLKTLRLNSHFIYQDEILIRGKGRKGFINCTNVSNNRVIILNQDTEILSFLDICW
jgi:hypothetical protein